MTNWKNTNVNPKHKEYKRKLQFIRDRKVQLMKRITPAEREVMHILKYLKAYYKFQKVFFHKNTLYIVDFFLPRQKIVIEVDGTQHQTDQRQVQYDKERTNFLETKRGVKVIRFTNSEVFETPDLVFNKLESVVR